MIFILATRDMRRYILIFYYLMVETFTAKQKQPIKIEIKMPIHLYTIINDENSLKLNIFNVTGPDLLV